MDYSNLVDKLERESTEPIDYLKCMLEVIGRSEKINFWVFLNVIPVNDRRTLCRMLDVEEGKGGWECFLEFLGLTKAHNRNFCRQYPGKVGPTETGMDLIIDEGGYDKNLTLSLVLKHFIDSGRYDIFNQIDWPNLLALHEKLDGIEIINFKSLFEVKTLFIEPIPSVVPERICSKDPLDSKDLIKPNLSVVPDKLSTNEPYAFLFYAPDAKFDAMQVTERLTQEWNFHILRIDDPIVQAQLLSDPSNIIHKWFLQVNFIIPILSPQLLRHIQNLDKNRTALFNRYLFNLTQHQFVFDYSSKNHRCRPLCPEKFRTEVDQNPVMEGNSLLKMYWHTSKTSIDEAAQIMKILSTTTNHLR